MGLVLAPTELLLGTAATPLDALLKYYCRERCIFYVNSSSSRGQDPEADTLFAFTRRRQRTAPAATVHAFVPKFTFAAIMFGA